MVNCSPRASPYARPTHHDPQPTSTQRCFRHTVQLAVSPTHQACPNSEPPKPCLHRALVMLSGLTFHSFTSALVGVFSKTPVPGLSSPILPPNSPPKHRFLSISCIFLLLICSLFSSPPPNECKSLTAGTFYICNTRICKNTDITQAPRTIDKGEIFAKGTDVCMVIADHVLRNLSGAHLSQRLID